MKFFVIRQKKLKFLTQYPIYYIKGMNIENQQKGLCGCANGVADTGD